MCMSAMPLEEIRKLPVEERLQLVEDIWDTIVNEHADLPLTPAQEKELDRRLAAHRADPDTAQPWEVVRARILDSD